MENCKYCNTELTHVPGRKKKMFCNVNCRNNYFNKNKAKVQMKCIPKTEYERLLKAIDEKNVGTEIKIQDLTKPTNLVKAVTDKKQQSNITIDTRPKKEEKSIGLTPYQEMIKKKRGF